MTYLFAFIAPALAAAVAYAVNLPQSLGAHPWWSQSVILIGFPIGMGLAAALGWMRLVRTVRLLALFGLAGVSALIAQIGKARFAVSYAEDAFAGQMWYIGWIATCALTAALMASAFWPRRNAH